MVSDEKQKMDEILGFIRTRRYSMEKAPGIEELFGKMAVIHDSFAEQFKESMNAFLKSPHDQSLNTPVTKAQIEYLKFLRLKAEQLHKDLEDDDVITMQAEVLNFLNALQEYLASASGIFIERDGRKGDLIPLIVESTISHNGSNASIGEDLGSKMSRVYNQFSSHWKELGLASEKLWFILRK